MTFTVAAADDDGSGKEDSLSGELLPTEGTR